jgi:hypothetical protein
MLKITFIRYAQNHLHYFERIWLRLFLACLMKVILSIPDEGYFEHTWWRLFWAYLMKVISSIPDEGYFEHTWWRLFWAYLMKVILSIPDEGYFEHTWWRLFQKRVVHTKFNIYALCCDGPWLCIMDFCLGPDYVLIWISVVKQESYITLRIAKIAFLLRLVPTGSVF